MGRSEEGGEGAVRRVSGASGAEECVSGVERVSECVRGQALEAKPATKHERQHWSQALEVNPVTKRCEANP